MNNGYIHSQILIRGATRQFLTLGARISREYPVSVQGRRGIIDLRVDFPSFPLACEAENTPRRVAWDMDKAHAMGAKALVVLVPTRSVAAACRRQVALQAAQKEGGCLWVSILTLGTLPEWLAKYLPLISPSFETSKTIPTPQTGHSSSSTHYPEL